MKLATIKGSAGRSRENAKKEGTLLLQNRNRTFDSKKHRCKVRGGKFGVKNRLRQELQNGTA